MLNSTVLEVTVKTHHIDTLYNSKILYNVSCFCKNVPLLIEYDFISTEIQFNVKVFWDKLHPCIEG